MIGSSWLRQQQLFGIEKLNVSRSDIPTVAHVDYSARIQTVHRQTNPRYHALIGSAGSRVARYWPIPASMCEAEPMVGTPEDVLAVGNCLLRKQDQDPELSQGYKAAFDLD
jgi:carbamoyltransferase